MTDELQPAHRPDAPANRRSPRVWLGARWSLSRWVIVIFVAGVAIRLLVMILYSNVTLTYYGGDSTRYLRLPLTGYRGLFSDPLIPAGYAAFLHVARWISSDIVFTIGLQHLVGVATAAFLFCALRQVGTPVWGALLPAGVVLFSGDNLFLETSLLTETLSMLMLAAAVFATFKGGSSGSRWILALAGALFALSAIVRAVSLPLALLAAIWVAYEIGGPASARLGAAACVVVGAVIVVAAYAGLARAENGYAAFTDMGGFNLYGRVAGFADCRDFQPPTGTAGLCRVSAAQRGEGTSYFLFDPGSPLYRAGFRDDARDSPALGRFARAAILHQPGQYVSTVLRDLARYVAPYAIAAPRESGVSPGGMSFYSTVPVDQSQSPALLASQYAIDYSHVDRGLPRQWIRELLGGYQEVFRVSGLVVVVLTLLAIAGAVLAAGRTRRALLFLLAIAGYLYLAPVALTSYDVRYGVPPGIFLAAAAGVGAPVILSRVRPTRAAGRMREPGQA